MDKEFLKCRVDSIVYSLDPVDYYQFVYEKDYLILEVVLNKICLFESFFRRVIMVAEYLYASDWHLELLPLDGNLYNQYKLCFIICNKRYEK